jgi:mitochondrial inner membrane protease ATP23
MSGYPSTFPSGPPPPVVSERAWRKCVRMVEYARKNCALWDWRPRRRVCVCVCVGAWPTASPHLYPLPSPLLHPPSSLAAPRVHTLLKKINASGCALASDPIVCEDAFGGAPVAGAFDSDKRAVVMNPAVPESFLTQDEWTRAVTHELVHAFDACRVKLEPQNCSHIACTEVRAANLSGDCDFGVELARLTPVRLAAQGLSGHQQACVRRRAELSLSMHEQCRSGPAGGPAVAAAAAAGEAVAAARAATTAADAAEAAARRAAASAHVSRTVASVFDACYADAAPFANN